MTKIAFFDFDGTLTEGDSIISFMNHARSVRQKISRRKLFKGAVYGLLYVLKLKDEKQSKAAAMAFLNDMTGEEQAEFCREYAETVLKKLLLPGGLEKIRQLKEEGYAIWIVSASTENYMRYIAPMIGADELICTRLDDHNVPIQNCKGADKVIMIHERMRERGIDERDTETIAFGDSPSDLMMLRFADKGYAVNAKKKLRENSSLEQISW